MKKYVYLCSALATAAILNGCCDMRLENPAQPKIKEIVDAHKQNINRAEELDLLCGKAWVPVYIKGQEGVDGKNAITLPENVQAYIEFHRDGKISGFAGVNHFNGAFAVTAPNQLRFGSLATTLQAGPHLDYEMLMMAQLNDADHFEMLKSGEIEFRKRNMLMMRCKSVALKNLKRTAPKAMTPVPPEPKSSIAPKKTGGALNGNPALPTVGNLQSK